MRCTLDSICRACLALRVDGAPLTDMFTAPDDLAAMLAACTGLRVSPDDGLPPTLCEECCSRAAAASAFRRTCQQSDAKLRQFFAVASNAPQENNLLLPPYDCHLCTRPPFRTARDLVVHALDCHSVGGDHTFDCATCKRVFHGEFYLKKHEVLHENLVDGKITCPLCSQVFPQRRSLIKHMDTHADDSPFCCIDCKCCFVKESHLKMHKLWKHQTSANRNSTATSPDDDLFESLDVKLEPESTVENLTVDCEPIYSRCNDNIYKLQLDDDISNFPSNSNASPNNSEYDEDVYDLVTDSTNKSLKISFKKKKKSKSYKGKLRNNKYHQESPVSDTSTNQTTLHEPDEKSTNASQKRNMKELSFLCSICGKGYNKQRGLDKHMGMHMKEDIVKPSHQCPICGKVVNHSNHLMVHMRTHKDINGQFLVPQKVDPNKKVILCSMCGKSCSSRSNLAVHMRRHLGVVTCRCKICGKGYPRTTDLTLHMRQHTGERPFACDNCKKTFTRSDKLAIHMRIHTGERPYRCQICNRAFAQSNDLVAHKKRNNCAPNVQSTGHNIDVDKNDSSVQDQPTSNQHPDVEMLTAKLLIKQPDDYVKKEIECQFVRPDMMELNDDGKAHMLQARTFNLAAAAATGGAFGNNFLVVNQSNDPIMNLISSDAMTARAVSNLVKQNLLVPDALMTSQRMLSSVQRGEFAEFNSALLQNLTTNQPQQNNAQQQFNGR